MKVSISTTLGRILRGVAPVFVGTLTALWLLGQIGLWGIYFLGVIGNPSEINGYAALVCMSAALLWSGYRAWEELGGTEFSLGLAAPIAVSIGRRNVFDCDEALFVPVNDFFDYTLQDMRGNKPVSDRSIHGQLIARLGEQEFKRQVLMGLEGQRQNSQKERGRQIEPRDRYPLGTTVEVLEGQRRYFLVATTRTVRRSESHERSSTLRDQVLAVHAGLEQALKRLDGATLVMPLIGGGYGRSSLDPSKTLCVLLACIYDVVARNGLKSPIVFALQQKDLQRLRVREVRRLWSAREE